LIQDFVDSEFALSFTGDGYLFTELLTDEHPDIPQLTITIKPLSNEGLVMFAYDEEVCQNLYVNCNLLCSCDRLMLH